MAKSEIINDYNESRINYPASSVVLEQNVSGTNDKIDTPLTQPCSGDVPMTDFTETRSKLKKLAMAHGAETAIGRACHNLLEQTENYVRTEYWPAKFNLKQSIEREMARLEQLRQSPH